MPLHPDSMKSSSQCEDHQTEHHHQEEEEEGTKEFNLACSRCRQSHRACSGEIPCKRCIHLGRADTCERVKRKRRGRPPKSAKTDSLAVRQTTTAITSNNTSNVAPVSKDNLKPNKMKKALSKAVPPMNAACGESEPLNYSPPSLSSSSLSLYASNASTRTQIIKESNIPITSPLLHIPQFRSQEEAAQMAAVTQQLYHQAGAFHQRQPQASFHQNTETKTVQSSSPQRWHYPSPTDRVVDNINPRVYSISSQQQHHQAFPQLPPLRDSMDDNSGHKKEQSSAPFGREDPFSYFHFDYRQQSSPSLDAQQQSPTNFHQPQSQQHPQHHLTISLPPFPTPSHQETASVRHTANVSSSALVEQTNKFVSQAHDELVHLRPSSNNQPVPLSDEKPQEKLLLPSFKEFEAFLSHQQLPQQQRKPYPYNWG